MHEYSRGRINYYFTSPGGLVPLEYCCTVQCISFFVKRNYVWRTTGKTHQLVSRGRVVFSSLQEKHYIHHVTGAASVVTS